MVRQMIATGDQTGKLGLVMGRIADFYERELLRRIATLSKLAEPVMLLFMGVAVGVIVTSLILPIFKLAKGALSILKQRSAGPCFTQASLGNQRESAHRRGGRRSKASRFRRGRNGPGAIGAPKDRSIIMKLSQMRSQGKGFTLVELLIVVIILSILAAIVVPQFASSTTDAKFSALDTNLGSLRAATELYYQQHGHYPGSVAVLGRHGADDRGGGDRSAGSAGLHRAADPVLERRWPRRPPASDATYKYGPYLKKGIPLEPVTGSAAVEISHGRRRST